LADNLQANPFVGSCHHCDSVFGPPPETLPREHTTKRACPRKNWGCGLQKRRSDPLKNSSWVLTTYQYTLPLSFVHHVVDLKFGHVPGFLKPDYCKCLQMDPPRCKTMKNLRLFAHNTSSSRNSIVDTGFFAVHLTPLCQSLVITLKNNQQIDRSSNVQMRRSQTHPIADDVVMHIHILVQRGWHT
jgi:hypothetical protein